MYIQLHKSIVCPLVIEQVDFLKQLTAVFEHQRYIEMTRFILVLLVILASPILKAQSTIYSKAYGESNNPAVIYIHGGPRGNSTLFEGTTAESLANRGFYVIIYDRRGEGRSVDTTATFTFQEALEDLDAIYKNYQLRSAHIIAHSFGGLVGTLFTQQYPEKVQSLILVGALFSQQQTYNHILATAKKNYLEKKDSLMVSKILEIEKLPKNSAEYRKKCYEVAAKNNYFKMPFPTKESMLLQENYQNSDFAKNNIRNDNAPLLFYKNEVKNNMDTSPILINLKKQVKLYAIYGAQDQIFSPKQFKDIKNIVTDDNFKSIDNCSHYPFVDQQIEFINTVEQWLK